MGSGLDLRASSIRGQVLPTCIRGANPRNRTESRAQGRTTILDTWMLTTRSQISWNSPFHGGVRVNLTAGGLRMCPGLYLCFFCRLRESGDKAYISETFLISEPSSGTNIYRRVWIGSFTGKRRSFDLTLRRTVFLAWHICFIDYYYKCVFLRIPSSS
jgi:hypothetical protein